MNKKFCIQRFSSLFLRYWVEYRIALLLLMILSVPIVYFYETGNGRIQFAGGFISGALSVFMIVFLYLAFRCVDNKKRLGYFLLLPASSIEKFLFLIFAGIVLPYLLLVTELFVVKGFLYFVPQEVVRRVENVSNVSDFISLSTFISTSFVFLVIVTIRLLQKQGAILRSVFVLIAGVLILTIVNDLIVLKLFGNYIKSDPFGKMKFEIGHKTLIDAGLYTDFLPYSVVLFGCFLVAMLYLTFMKFREMEKGL